MSVKVTNNTPQIKFDMNTKIRLFLRYMLDEIERISDPLTPKKEGHLRRDILKVVQVNTASITWTKEYAAAQEVGTTRGFTIRNYTTPGTSSQFALRGVIKAVATAETTLRKARLI